MRVDIASPECPAGQPLPSRRPSGGAVFGADEWVRDPADERRPARAFAGVPGMTRAASPSGEDADALMAALMASAQGGDRAAYEALLKLSVPLIKRAVRRAGVRDHRVDDAVQDVLMTVHRARQTYDPGRSFAAWLSVIAQRRAIDLLRQGGRQAEREVFSPASYETYPDAAPDPEEAWTAEDRTKVIAGAVAALPPGQREAVETIVLRQLSLSEAAAVTGKTKGALKVNLHRALKALRARTEGGA